MGKVHYCFTLFRPVCRKKIPPLGVICGIGFNIISKFWRINISCISETNSANF